MFWDQLSDLFHTAYIILVYEGVKWVYHRLQWRYQFKCNQCNMKFASTDRESRDRVQESHIHIGEQ